VILLLLAAQAFATQASAAPPTPLQAPSACRALIADDPGAAERQAGMLPLAGTIDGSVCRGLALSAQDRYADAAGAFGEAAHAAELAKDTRAADYWAQSGNAWLAAGDATKARNALDAALAAGTLTDLQRGEAHLDRARALVAADKPGPARIDLDQAIAAAPEDPLAWLLSATLARRMGDLPRARTDIAQALRRSSDDASVQLEAGNIAAQAGEADKAQAAWRIAARLAPDTPAGRSATNALTQFAGDTPK
jgi:tetratricopeptide (TPR) repeat protein